MSIFEKASGHSGLRRLLVATAVVLAVSLATGSLVPAQTPQDPTDTAPPGAPSALGDSTDGKLGETSASHGLTNERDVEAFLDELFARQLESYESQAPPSRW
jgi:hypothetical protein